ncbi:thiopeptide-type bacteriocin biosynthesis protein [Streptomyces sp. NRRL S-87]|uniref:thiopeptide-type bacteriocin biosynthesis protein n=1 Tax=Streptomyces sp. NRRL S-87 TaxID=1463920 RepID=UPI00099D0AD0|nr:thiopeptide-type bacteriocin biosynthesis protein [Streptomyces sp. NRRL S-87]
MTTAGPRRRPDPGPEVPEAPEAREAPEAPETADPSETPETPETPESPETPETSAPWHGLHLALHTGGPDTDAFVTDVLAPLMDGMTAHPHAGWFFIRYGEGGPHLRIRYRGPLPAGAAAGLPARLAGAAASWPAAFTGPWPARHGEVRAVPYVPETDRYGGPTALPLAEEVFVRSTRAAVEALRATPDRGARLPLALDVAHATAHALGLDELAGARWLRRHAASWRWVTEVEPLPGAAVHSRVNSVFALRRPGLVRRARALRASLDAGTAAPWLAEWARHVAAAEARLRGGAVPEDEADRRLPWVWASQLHMLFNRLGVTPDEERAVCRLAARTLMETGDDPDFFPAGHRAADYQYLERSKFRIGRPEDTALRDLPPLPAPSAARLGAELPLPAAPLPELPLGEALRRRSSVRGALSGPLDAGTLGGVLWSAYAESHTTRQPLAGGGARTLRHRPYPSAGALYSVRVRLVALDVAGVAAGTYHCVPERRALLPIGPAPAVAALKALSSYLSRPADDPDAVGVDAVPAVLAVHLDLALLRRRYGLRALRLGLLEAGHLAQTLLLTAAAFGLATVPLGGLHDDLAHELLGLDDLDEPVQYLLPLGRPPGPPAAP